MMWVPMRYFALSVLFWFSIVSSSSLELSHVVRREDIVPKLPWKPKSCYKREQVCCYRYKKCGNRCRTGYCSQQSMCSHYKFGKCFRWRSVNTCTTVCFDKMCVRFECVPLKMVRGRSYVHPRIHTKVYYPQGKNPPKPPKPSRKPRPTTTASPATAPSQATTRSQESPSAYSSSTSSEKDEATGDASPSKRSGILPAGVPRSAEIPSSAEIPTATSKITRIPRPAGFPR